MQNKTFIMKHLIFCLVLIFLSNALAGSISQIEIDSLIKTLDGCQSDHLYGERLLTVIEVIHKSDPDGALVYGKEALKLIPVVNERDFEMKVYNALSGVYLVFLESKLGLKYGEQARSIAIDLEDKAGLQLAYSNIGTAHYIGGNLQKAMENYQFGLNVFDIKNQNSTKAKILANMGNVLHQQGNPDKAIYFYKEANRFYTATFDLNGMASCLTNIGAQYSYKGQNQDALSNFLKALDIIKKANNKRIEVLVLMNIADEFIYLGKLDKSKKFYKKALVLSEVIKDDIARGRVYFNLANIANKHKNCFEASQLARMAIDLTRKTSKNSWTLDAYSILQDCYIAAGDFENAYKYKMFYQNLRDSLYTLEKSARIHEISTKYEAQKKDIENQLLKKETAESRAIINQQKTIGLLSLVLLITILSVIIRIYIEKSRYNEKLEQEVASRTSELEFINEQLRESNIELERFAYIASHDLKEPIKNIINFGGLLKNELHQERFNKHSTTEYVEIINSSSNRLYQLIEEVLEFSRVGSKSIGNKTECITKVVEDVASTISSTLEIRKVEFNIGELPMAKVNQSYLFIVVKNLVENGIKYNDKANPRIEIYGKIINDSYQLFVKDNGIGIDEKYFEKIFGMFERLNNRTEYAGTGLGLSICKKIINKMGGNIRLKSKLGVGSTFVFEFPLTKQLSCPN